MNAGSGGQDLLVSLERRRGRSWCRLVAASGRSWVLDREALLQLGLDRSEALPQPLPPHLAGLLDEAERGTARRRALSLLAHRSRSRQELIRLLSMWPLASECIEDAVEWAASLGYVSDRDLAAQVVQSSARNPVGRRLLMERLLQRGLEPELARKAVAEELPQETEREQAIELARRRAARLTGAGERERARRVYQFLVRRGFEDELAAEAVRVALGTGVVESVKEGKGSNR